MLPRDVAVLGADREGRREGEVRQTVAAADGAHELLHRARVVDPLADEDVLHRPAGVLRLELVLVVEQREDVLLGVHRELRGVGVERVAPGAPGLLVGAAQLGEAPLVDPRETVARPFRRRRLEVEEGVGLLLVPHQPLAHVVEDAQPEGAAARVGQPAAEQVLRRLVHPDDADRREVVVPVAAVALADAAQVVAHVRIEAVLGVALEHLALDDEAVARDVHQPVEPGEELVLVLREEAEARQVERDDADRAGQRVGAEEAAAAPVEAARVEAQPAAHAPRVLRGEVGIDEVGEVRQAVARRRRPERREPRVVVVEAAGDVVGRDREGEDPPLRVPAGHHLEEGAVEEVHLRLELAVRLLEPLAADDHRLAPQRLRHVEVERDVGERRLEADARRHVEVEDELLQRLPHLLVAEAVAADERREVGVHAGEGLRPRGLALQRVEEVRDLPEGGAEVARRPALRLAGRPLEPLRQQVAEVPADAVDGEQVEVVDVQVAVEVRAADLRRIEPLEPVGRADVAGDVVVQPLQAEPHVRVFGDLPVAAVEVAVHERDARRVGDGAQRAVLLAVDDVGARRPAVRAGQQHLLDDVLDPLDGRRAVDRRPADGEDAPAEPPRLVGVVLAGRRPRLGDRRADPLRVERHDAAVALRDALEHRRRAPVVALGGRLVCHAPFLRSRGMDEGRAAASPTTRRRLDLTCPPARHVGRTVRLRRRAQAGLRARERGGLTAAVLLPAASRPRARPVRMAGFVLAYRCGAAPDSHRVPSSA